MRIEKPGVIADQILFLGSPSICMYLVMGEQYALIGGGVPWEVPRIEAQLDQYHVDRNRIRYIVISHAHHDHCGAVPYLISKYPHIKTVASEYCAYILNKSKPVSLIKEVIRKTLDSLNRPHWFNGIPLDFRPVPVAMRMGDGNLLDLGGGLSLRFYNTPGHSRCSLSVYIPEIEALFPGDALPFPEKGKQELTVTANHDYDDYIRSLEKLEPLPIRLVCYEHGGVLRGNDVEKIIPRSLAATHQQRERIRKRYEELKDIDRLVDEMTEKYRSVKLFQMVPSDIMRAIVKKMVRTALGWV